MLPELEGYDWQNAFGYAGEPNNNYITANINAAIPNAPISADSFTRDDVVHIEGIREGENDERPWLIYGKLSDGRWFFIEAGCDYTGWDCQTYGRALVASTKNLIIRYAMGHSNRIELNISPSSMFAIDMWQQSNDDSM